MENYSRRSCKRSTQKGRNLDRFLVVVVLQSPLANINHNSKDQHVQHIGQSVVLTQLQFSWLRCGQIDFSFNCLKYHCRSLSLSTSSNTVMPFIRVLQIDLATSQKSRILGPHIKKKNRRKPSYVSDPTVNQPLSGMVRYHFKHGLILHI